MGESGQDQAPVMPLARMRLTFTPLVSQRPSPEASVPGGRFRTDAFRALQVHPIFRWRTRAIWTCNQCSPSFFLLPPRPRKVIPFQAGENGASPGPFTLFGVGNDTDADVAFMESVAGTTFNDDALTLRRLNRLHRNLAEAALSQEDSLELVERIERDDLR